ncbi:hypothetical protein CSKR_107238 [Clonorchis sinensis]|uniref:Uncharacterized protein n=1 Tax=Clonorchis sinensis TaxID=79923 RepID=A0A3R7G6T8_CLOSI|nr:hypothetical protein CSKR_107238 [Clonorchis sinensis]
MDCVDAIFHAIAQWLERKSTDRKARGSSPTSASRLLPSRLGRLNSIPALVLPSGGMVVRHRKGARAERCEYSCFRISPITLDCRTATFLHTLGSILSASTLNETLLSFNLIFSCKFSTSIACIYFFVLVTMLLKTINIIIIIDSVTVFNTDASLPYNHGLFESLIVKKKNKDGWGGLIAALLQSFRDAYTFKHSFRQS